MCVGGGGACVYVCVCACLCRRVFVYRFVCVSVWVGVYAEERVTSPGIIVDHFGRLKMLSGNNLFTSSTCNLLSRTADQQPSRD